MICFDIAAELQEPYDRLSHHLARNVPVVPEVSSRRKRSASIDQRNQSGTISDPVYWSPHVMRTPDTSNEARLRAMGRNLRMRGCSRLGRVWGS